MRGTDMHKNIKGVIFDFGGVISTGHNKEHVDEILDLLGIADREAFYNLYMDLRIPYDAGHMSAEDYWQRIIDHFGSRRPPLDRLVELDVGSWTIINHDVLDFAAALRAHGIITAVLSNMNVDALAFIEREFPWMHDFDHLVYSCDLGICKPQREIYKYCVHKMGLKPKECLFLDDNRINVDSADRYGIHAVFFEGQETLNAIKRNFFCNIFAEKKTQNY